MKKSTKVISMVIAVTLVMAIMTFVIYAATAGKVGINASVSWTAQAGVDLEFWGRVSGGDTTKEIAKTYINPTTTNARAKIVDDLSCNFSDNTDDGVNNPKAITFKYYVRNKSLTPLKIQVTKHPTQAEESGTSEADHTPKVELSSQVGEENTLVSAIGAGYDLKAGDLFEYSVTLSMASGGTGNINANTGLAQNFDAGVTFNFTVGGNSDGTIATSVDGASPTTVNSSTLAGQTLGEYLATRQTAEYSTGWFFDEGLTKVVSDDYLNQNLKDSSASSFYNKTASITGLTFTLSSGGNSYLVAGESNTSPSGEVVIPNMYNGKPVSGFVAGTSSSPTFKKNGNITSVILPNSITYISNYAFYYSTKITNITIPESVTSIENYAFAYCSSLADAVISESVTSLGSGVFRNCGALTGVLTIPDNLIVIKDYTFQGCSKLTGELIIHNRVASIGSYAFNECSGLTGELIIPNSVTSIGNHAFQNCSGLTNIVVANGNKKYDSRNNCNAIIETASNTLIQGCSNTIIPNTVTKIGSSAFEKCRGLTGELILPNSLISIGSSAFNRCSGLTGVLRIPSGITSIESHAFAYCSGLTSIELTESVTSIESNAFAYCSGLTGKLTIPNNVTSIGGYAFYNCSGLTSVTIGNSVTSIGNYAFQGCRGLTGDLIIPDSVTSIGSASFNFCSGLTRVFIPESVTTISASSASNCPFYGCSSALKIYCEADSKPSGWGTYWATSQFTVTWGVTRAEFDAL